jgi:adenylate cyclase
VIGVELRPMPGGTEVRPWITIEPRNALGAAARWGAAPRWTRGLLHQCRRFERYLRGEAESPFPQLTAPGGVARERLDALAADQLGAGQDATLVGRLRRHLAEAPDVDASSMRPFELADRWGADRRAILGLCLHATMASMLELSWQVLCPNCRVPKAEYRHLGALETTVHCETCQVRFDVDFDRLVEARFDPAPAIRRVERETFCLAGPWSAPHVLAQATIPAGATQLLGAQLEPGPHRLRALRGGSATLRARDGGPATVAVTVNDGRPEPREMEVGTGAVEVVVANRGDAAAVMMLERAAWLDTVATGAIVGTLPEFRQLFLAEVLAPGIEVRIQRLAFLFTDLAGSTALYERAGEARAFRLVQDHFRILAAAVGQHHGAIVKTIGDAVMAAFPMGGDAQAAAAAIQREIRGLDDRGVVDPTCLVRVGVHEGPCLAVTQNDRLDYFGTTLNTAARIEHECRGGEIVASAAVYERPEAARRLEALPVEVEPFERQLRGLSEPIRLYRIRPLLDDALAPASTALESSRLPAG